MSGGLAEHYRSALVRNARALSREVADRTGLSRRAAARRTAGVPDAVFLWVPKTAGTSLWRLLEQRGGGLYKTTDAVASTFPGHGLASFGHMHYPELVKSGAVPADFAARAYKFAVVRNPFERAVSLFHYLRNERKLPQRMPFELFAELLATGGFEPVGAYNTLGLSQCNPQVAWLLDADGSLLPDAVGRFEDLDAFVRVLNERLGVDGTLTHENRSLGRESYQGCYSSPVARRCVERAYAADLERFDYVF